MGLAEDAAGVGADEAERAALLLLAEHRVLLLLVAAHRALFGLVEEARVDRRRAHAFLLCDDARAHDARHCWRVCRVQIQA